VSRSSALLGIFDDCIYQVFPLQVARSQTLLQSQSSKLMHIRRQRMGVGVEKEGDNADRLAFGRNGRPQYRLQSET